MDILLWQRLTSRLPNQLPTEAKVAHKTGTGVLGRNNNDAGIVFQGDTPLFILTVYTEHLPVNMPHGTSGYLHAGTDDREDGEGGVRRVLGPGEDRGAEAGRRRPLSATGSQPRTPGEPSRCPGRLVLRGARREDTTGQVSPGRAEVRRRDGP